MKHHFVLLAALAMTGCPGLAKKIIRPPTYDEQCVPSDDTYLKLAYGTQDLAESGEIPSDPQEALDEAHRAIDQAGYELVVKSETGKEQLDMFTTTLDGVIFLEHDWDTKSVVSRAITLWHELVHVRQWERLGPEKMTLLYIVTEGRWAIEVPAYRESARVRVLFGASDERQEEWMPGRIDSFYESYALYAMPKDCMEQLTEAAWAPEWREAA